MVLFLLACASSGSNAGNDDQIVVDIKGAACGVGDTVHSGTGWGYHYIPFEGASDWTPQNPWEDSVEKLGYARDDLPPGPFAYEATGEPNHFDELATFIACSWSPVKGSVALGLSEPQEVVWEKGDQVLTMTVVVDVH